MSTISIIRGDDVSLEIELLENDLPFDLTDSSVFLTVKSDLSDDDEDALIAKEVTEHTDPENGETAIDLTGEDTDIDPGNYLYDIQIKDAEDKIMSTRHGVFTVISDVTKRTGTE